MQIHTWKLSRRAEEQEFEAERQRQWPAGL
jgi:hypothetical protein